MTKKLLFSVTIKDCEIQAFCATGPGGQHKNRVKTAIRIIHKPSGAVGVATDNKSQHANKKAAFERMAKSEKFQKWIKVEAARKCGEKSAEEKVEELMNVKNIKIEARNEENKWQEYKYEELNDK